MIFHFSFTPKADREGGTPIDINVKRLDMDGFDAEREHAKTKFIPPCLYYTCSESPAIQSNKSVSSALTKEVTYLIDLDNFFFDG